MKKGNILWGLLLLFFLPGCYKDLGNYDYKEINELEVDSIRAAYACDRYDTLTITPILKGSQYSDTSRFTYTWEIGGIMVASTHHLRVEVDLVPGYKYSRYIVTDKATGVKKYFEFGVNVSSSTAGDLIMVLSKYQGRAELSYLRLDKPANWIVNYSKDRFGQSLGIDPQQLSIFYLESWQGDPFVNYYGRISVLVDNQINLIDKSTLMPDTVTPILTKEAYLSQVSYPKPEIEAYKSEFIEEAVNIWRYVTYGAQQWTYNMQISAGCLYTASLASAVWTSSYSYNKKSPYNEGYLAPFGYWDDVSDTPHDNNLQAGYALGDFIVFDRNHHRFATASGSGAIKDIKEEDLKSFPDYDLLWGSATNRASNTSIAVLNNGDQCKLVLLQNGKTADGKQNTKKLAGEISGSNFMNAKSGFYMMKYNDYLFFSGNNKVFCYNIMNINSGVMPGEKDKVIDLTQYGYSPDAVITDICVSRTERTLLVGVSRYGSDSQAQGEEPKGDILYFDLNKSTMGLTYNAEKSKKGVSGIPLDIKIKYQTHWRNGEDTAGKMKDNI